MNALIKLHLKYLVCLISTTSLPFLQLGNIVSKENSGYQFVDRNSWPISQDQEENLTLLDVLVNGAVTVIPAIFQSSYHYSDRTLSFDASSTEMDIRSPPNKRAR